MKITLGKSCFTNYSYFLSQSFVSQFLLYVSKNQFQLPLQTLFPQ